MLALVGVEQRWGLTWYIQLGYYHSVVVFIDTAKQRF